MTRRQTRQWFGSFLQWSRDEDGWWTLHAGRQYRIVKLNREAAPARPGWHFAVHPDLAEGEYPAGPGPRLSTNLANAKKMAEVWILTPERDHWPTDEAPSVVSAAATGAGFSAADGTVLIAEADDENGQIVVRRASASRAGGGDDRSVLGTITPQLSSPSPMLTWHPTTAGRSLPATTTWHAAAQAIGCPT